jgi:hypothetical protein
MKTILRICSAYAALSTIMNNDAKQSDSCDDESESKEEELSQGIFSEGWEYVFNELDQMEEEYLG